MSAESASVTSSSSPQVNNQRHSSAANLRSLNHSLQSTSTPSSSSSTSSGVLTSVGQLKPIPSTVNSIFSVDLMSPIHHIPMLGSLHSSTNPSSHHHSLMSGIGGGGNISNTGHQNTHNSCSNSSHHHLNGSNHHNNHNSSTHHFQSSSLSLMSNHEAMRRGRYSCPICLKAFSEKGNMKRHTLIHLPQRHRYQCDLCSKGFSWKDNFNRHRRSHHI